MTEEEYAKLFKEVRLTSEEVDIIIDLLRDFSSDLSFKIKTDSGSYCPRTIEAMARVRDRADELRSKLIKIDYERIKE